jgi:hypothetical protein
MREISATHGCKGCKEFLCKLGTQAEISPLTGKAEQGFGNQRSRSDPNLTSFVDKWSEPVEKSVIEEHECDDRKA